MNTVALFAGQGAQTVGMGQDLISDPDVASLFTRAQNVLGYDIGKICFEGPIEELTASDKCQPAIFVVSAALYTLFQKKFPNYSFDGFAGLSLGEWTALWAAGVVDFESGVRILSARGRFMQDACLEKPTGMVSILKLPFETVKKIASETGLHISNINSDAQVNLSGPKELVEKAANLAKEEGGLGAILNVAGAFHSPFMESARRRLAPILDEITFSSPKTPVFSNATGKLHDTDPAKIKSAMLDQITGTVRWLDCIIASDAHNFIEFGPGKVLTSLAKRINRQNKAQSVQTLETLEKVEL